MPPFPAHLMSVAEWRRRLRGLIYDLPLATALGEVVDPALLVTLPDAALDEALREALSAYGVWVPSVRPLPPLTLSPAQSAYPLPADFDEPDISGPGQGGWTPLLGPDPLESGRYPGARHALLLRQSLLDAPAQFGARGRTGGGYGGYGGYGFGGFWAGGLWDGTWPVAPTDAQGNIIAGGYGTYEHLTPYFYPASFDSPTPVMVFQISPPAQTFSNLRYRALWLPRRLALTPDGFTWQADPATGQLVSTVCPPGQDLADATDVLPFWAGDDAVRLTLRYAQGWALTQKILSLPDDSVKYAFFEERTGMARADIQKVANIAFAEFNDRTKKVPRGTRG